MAAYVIGAIQSVNDPAAFLEYQNLALPTLAKYGGTVVVGALKSKWLMGIGRLPAW